MTGMSRAACTIAQAIRWVNDSLRPASLSARRRASRVSTSSVRKLVAVGIARLSFMKRASVAGPRMGVAVRSPQSRGPEAARWTARLGPGAAPPVSIAASTSALVTRPRGPLPSIALRSMPFASATRAATGVALAAPLPPAGRGSGVADRALSSRCGGSPAGVRPAVRARAPAAMRQRTVPVVTVSSGCTRISASVPATGEGSSASTLSVEISTSRSSASTRVADLLQPLEDGALGHRLAHLGQRDVHQLRRESGAGRAGRRSRLGGREVLHLGRRAVLGLLDGGLVGRLAGIGRGARLRRGAAVAGARLAIHLDLAQHGARGNGLVGLDQDLGQDAAGRGRAPRRRPCRSRPRPLPRPTSTGSPTCLSHSRIVPSVTDSPISGMVIWTVVRVVIEASPTIALRPPRGQSFRAGRAHAKLRTMAVAAKRRLKFWGWGYEDQQPPPDELRQAGRRDPRPPGLRAGRSRAPDRARGDRSARAQAVPAGRSRADLLVRGARAPHPLVRQGLPRRRPRLPRPAGPPAGRGGAAARRARGGGRARRGAPTPAPRRSRSAAAPAWSAASSRAWATATRARCRSTSRASTACSRSIRSRAPRGSRRGAAGPVLEDQLRPHGLTLRHFPQSFEFSTLGGWIATRAGGHFATRLHAHRRPRRVGPRDHARRARGRAGACPAPAPGPSPDRLLIGSEGILGVITEAWVRLQARPRFRSSASVLFATFEAGRGGRSRAVAVRARALQLPPARGPRGGLLTGAGDGDRALLVLGFESADHPLDAWMARALEFCADHGGEAPEGARHTDAESGDSGRGGGDAAGQWRAAFLAAPYVRDTMVAAGVFSETFETAITWDRLDGFVSGGPRAGRVRAARDGRGRHGHLPVHARLSRRRRALLHDARARRARRGARAVGRREGRGVGRGDRGGRHDHPPPRGRPRPPALVRPPAAGAVRAGAAGGEGGARPGGHPQPGRADRPGVPAGALSPPFPGRPPAPPPLSLAPRARAARGGGTRGRPASARAGRAPRTIASSRTAGRLATCVWRLPLPWPGVPHCNAWALSAGSGVVLVDTGLGGPGRCASSSWPCRRPASRSSTCACC